ncbi:MAG: sulfatase-like hydrolase/transferase [Acidobacteria bacterium]|nr:sulfatase-like hydrolase/transferase [Acidobacteriota bacterium]
MPTRRSVIRTLAAPLIGQSRPQRPNFLFLIGDDHAGYALGADGDPLALTPNLDRLAAEGTRFSRAYCNSPVCTPSRQSFLTGRMPHSAGVTRLPTRLSEDQPTLAIQLKKAGYRTGVIGKMHFNQPSRPGLHGFDDPMLEQDVTKAWNAASVKRKPEAGIRTKPPWRPFKDPARIWLNAEKLPYPRYDEEMRGTFIARRAAEYLAAHRGEPFALWVSFGEPHSPFDFPIEDRDLIQASKYRVPRVGPEDAWQIPLIFRDLSPEDKQGIAAAYYTSVHCLDRNAGRVLGALRQNGLDENTLVVYLGDNGYCLGHHGRFEKHSCYEPAIRCPLLMRWPGRIRRGVVTDFAEFADVAPTVLDLLGGEPLPVRHGRSLRPYLEGRKPSAPRDHVFAEYLENEEACIRTAKWKLIFCTGRRRRGDGYETDNPTPGRYLRLYDLERDPGEFTDVAATNPRVAGQLQGLMLDRFRKTHPEAAQEPPAGGVETALEFYLRPRDD